MSWKPLVSVIIPFYNAEKFIQEAIDSVFAQTYGNWELLLVDDGSTDATSEIALRYAEQYPNKVRYLQHEGRQNRGLSASRNRGISNAKGDFIAFLDADDVWVAHKVEEQVAILGAQPEAAAVYGPVQIWYSWTGHTEDRQRDYMRKVGVQANTLIWPPRVLTLFLREEIFVPTISAIMVRRKTVERIGGFEESFWFNPEDQVFLAKLCLNEPVFVASEWWCRYRQRPNSLSAIAEKTGRVHLGRLALLCWLEKYFSEQGVKGTEVWTTLENQLWPYRHSVLHRRQKRARIFIRQVKHAVRIFVANLGRAALRKSTGKIKARPNPIQLFDKSRQGGTTLQWRSKRTKTVEVHCDAPDGPLFSRTDLSGEASTGNWVRDGMVFYLQDVSDGKPLTSAHTLGKVTVYHHQVVPEGLTANLVEPK